MSSAMGETLDWGSLLKDLLVQIFERLDSMADIANFICVCKHWNSVFNHTYGRFMCGNQVPLLTIPTELEEDKSSNKRSLFCTMENRTLGIHLKVPYNKRCSGSSYGWLAFAEDDLSIVLFNPISKATITLPPITQIPTQEETQGFGTEFEIQKVILSADPSLSRDSFKVAVIYGIGQIIAITKAGEKRWTLFPKIKREKFHSSDMIYYRGKLYAVDNHGKVVEINTHTFKAQVLVCENKIQDLERYRPTYLAELSTGELVIIRRYGKPDDIIKDMVTCTFNVYKVEFNSEGKGQLQRVNNLDGDTVFLGDNHTISIAASKFTGCCIKPNCIYYSDDYHCIRSPYKYMGPHDMGEFDMADGSIKMNYEPNPLHKDMPPPFWFVLNFHPVK